MHQEKIDEFIKVKFMTHAWTRGELQFLLDAIHEVVRSRQLLKWTYVYMFLHSKSD